jgi:histidyl-tRNA synthetase
MRTAGTTAEQADRVLGFAALSGPNEQILMELAGMVDGSEQGREGVEKLAALLTACRAAGVPEERLKIDVSIARGLDYYTGTIYETFLDDLKDIGSVCSGGRYDNLAGLYTRQELPGVGASLGLDRLLAAMEELKMVDDASTPAEVFVAYFDAERLNDYLKLAAGVRAAGFGVETYCDPKKLGQQLKYAAAKGFRVALIAGSREFDAGECQVKDLRAGEATTVSLDGVVEEVRRALARS